MHSKVIIDRGMDDLDRRTCKDDIDPIEKVSINS